MRSIRILLMSSALFALPNVMLAHDTLPKIAPDAPSSADLVVMTAVLEDVVAPIALYPDALLIQILRAATTPLEVVKADRLLATGDAENPDVLRATIKARGWSESVEILAVAFPDVIKDMARRIEWTETLGNAMLVRPDDVMEAVQVMRERALATGALVPGTSQDVIVREDDAIVIAPADPEVVYVPEYDPDRVYSSHSHLRVGTYTTGLVAHRRYAAVGVIFGSDDYWFAYWGCRNCAGWGGSPIHHSADADVKSHVKRIGPADHHLKSGTRADQYPTNKVRHESRHQHRLTTKSAAQGYSPEIRSHVWHGARTRHDQAQYFPQSHVIIRSKANSAKVSLGQRSYVPNSYVGVPKHRPHAKTKRPRYGGVIVHPAYKHSKKKHLGVRKSYKSKSTFVRKVPRKSFRAYSTSRSWRKPHYRSYGPGKKTLGRKW